MAIEIIKLGTLPALKNYHATCRNCKTEIAFQAKDAVRNNDPRVGDYLTLQCPMCQLSIMVPA